MIQIKDQINTQKTTRKLQKQQSRQAKHIADDKQTSKYWNGRFLNLWVQLISFP